MPEEPSPTFGGWSAREMVATALLGSGPGTDEGVPEEVRFVAGIAKLVRRRLANDQAGGDPALPAIFLLAPVPFDVAEPTPTRVPMLNNGAERVNGRVWFVGAPAVSGHYMGFDATSDDDLFKLVTDTLSLGAVPTVVFDPRLHAPETRFYRRGLGEPDQVESILLADDDVTFEMIYPVIERVYQFCLVTPDAQLKAGKLWSDSEKGWASPVAEGIVQMQLFAGLVAAFPTCVVRPEQSMPEGRDDLEIERGDPRDPSQITRLALIELKVLRSFGEKGGVVREAAELGRVKDGVEQASVYQKNKSFKRASLCCFDMRRGDSGEKCFDHVRDLAKELAVDLKRWFIFSSSEDYRRALSAGRSTP